MAGAVASTPPGFGPASRAVARWAGRRGLTSLAVDRSAALLGVLAAVWFCGGDTRGAVAGSLLLLAVLFADSVAARIATRPADALRVWLGALLAGTRECAVFAGIAVGGAASGVAGAWEWAAAALVAVALRATVRDARWAAASRSRASDRGCPHRRVGSAVRRLAIWPHLVRLVQFSQDTRFAVVALTTVVWGPPVTFIALIVGCALTVTVQPRATRSAQSGEADNAHHPGE